jgi:hypothetical protein
MDALGQDRMLAGIEGIGKQLRDLQLTIAEELVPVLREIRKTLETQPKLRISQVPVKKQSRRG